MCKLSYQTAPLDSGALIFCIASTMDFDNREYILTNANKSIYRPYVAMASAC